MWAKLTYTRKLTLSARAPRRTTEMIIMVFVQRKLVIKELPNKVHIWSTCNMDIDFWNRIFQYIYKTTNLDILIIILAKPNLHYTYTTHSKTHSYTNKFIPEYTYSTYKHVINRKFYCLFVFGFCHDLESFNHMET